MAKSDARDSFGRRPLLTDQQKNAARRTGLTEHEARRQFRWRTIAECVVYALCWAILVAVSLPADRQALQWTGYPQRTTTVIQDPAKPGALMLQWIDPAGGLHDYQPDSDTRYTLGEHVQVVDPPNTCGWDTPSSVDGAVVGMIAVMGVLPLAGLALLIVHRVRLWRRLLHASTYSRSVGYSISLYKAPWRTFISIHVLAQHYYVPLMRDQRVESLEPLKLLKLLEPLVTPAPRAQVPFRVAGTDRVVWPAGGCHTSVWPIGQMALTVLRVFGPMLLLPFAHWMTSTLPPC
ncbi:hypothetical protein [Catenulispora sp. GP43]|uniref:hypothetical protein n=1 Tax=Catenulispora sp. GP43 TaxID=3156263 RepID=UPI0035178F2E